MDDESLYAEWMSSELTIQPLPSPSFDPLQEAEDTMMKKYGVDRSFVDVYVKHASERTANDIMKNFLLLPPGREDAVVLEKTIAKCVAALEKHDREYDSRKSAAVSEMTRLTMEKGKARNENDKKDCEAQAKAVMADYFEFASNSWKVLQILNDCSKKVPINTVEFHHDMQHFSRIVIGLRIKFHFPAFGDSVM